MERTLANRRQQTGPFIRPIILGGTGAVDAETAVANLGGIHLSQIDTPLGITGLDNNSKIDLALLPTIASGALPALDGATTLYTTSSPQTYLITNYDSQTTYNISTNKGSVSRIGNEITFTPPVTAGITVITINGKNFPINVLAPYTQDPIITYPQNGLVNVSLGATLTSIISVFGVNGPSFSGIEWQFATDAGFTDIVSTETINNQLGQNIELSALTTPLEKNTLYYVRVRYFVNELALLTGWSNVVNFTTTNFSLPSLETQIINDPPEAVALSADTPNFGQGLVYSSDESLLLISDILSQQVQIFHKVNSLWEFLHVITFPTILPNTVEPLQLARFGENVIISPDKSRIFISASQLTADVLDTGNFDSQIGGVFVYALDTPGDYTTYVFEELIFAPTPVIWSRFGSGLALNNAGTRLFIMTNTPDTLPSVESDNCGVFIYDVMAGANGIMLDQHITYPDPLSYEFGWGRLSINGSGTCFVLSDPWKEHLDGSNNVTCMGSIYVYKDENDDGNWDLTTINADPISPLCELGKFANISNDGNLIVAYYFETSDELYTNVKCGFKVYEKSGASWALKSTIFIPECDTTNLGYLGDFPGNVILNSDASIILLCAPSASIPQNVNTDGQENETGIVFVYSSDGLSWNQEESLFASDYQVGDAFGSFVTMNPSLTEIAITARSAPFATGVGVGKVYILR